MSTVSLMTSLLFQVFAAATQNARSPTVRRRVCGTARSADDANVVDLKDRRHGAGCHWDTSGQDPSDTEMPVLPAWKIFAVVHEASAAGEVEAWSGHTDSHWTLIVLLHSSPTATGVAGTTDGRPANVAFSESSFDNTRATTMDWKTEQVSERRILLSRLSLKKQFDTVRATWEHMLTSESK